MIRIKRICAKLLIAVALIGFGMPLPANSKGWETAKTEKVQTRRIVSDNDIEIKTGGGIIFITTNKSMNVKIFTILGSRIADDTLQPGSYQYAVASHGVYIIKAGDLTCKVAV